MASVRGRGRGGRGGGGGGDSSPKRGAWRGPNGPGPNGRVNSSIISGPPGSSKSSIHDHMADLGKVDDKTRKVFQTDADISASRGVAERDLQRWVPDGPDPAIANGNSRGGGGDQETFGNASTGAWDQFETNKRLFGGDTTYDENLYTTRLDRSAPDYKKREKEAERLANEIQNQSSTNSHIAEERNQATSGNKDEEEKYSGVVRNPHAYVPPAARKAPVSGAPGGFAAAAARGQAASSGTATPPTALKPNGTGKSTPTGPAAKASPAPAAAPPLAAPPIATSASNNPALSTTPSGDIGLTPPAPAGPTRSTSDGPIAAEETPKKASPLPAKLGLPAGSGAAPMAKTESKAGAGVVEDYRRFAEAEKQQAQKLARERQLAELVKFKDSFKVALPVPKDMLPILSKDAQKQKEIEERAAKLVLEFKAEASSSKANPATPSSAKKVAMKIQAIPPFGGSVKLTKPAALPIPATAGQDIKLATSPTPTDGAATATLPVKRLNPAASKFEFKPSAKAPAFKPGQPPAGPPAPLSTAGAGPSNQYSNPFFSGPPRPVVVNVRDDFVPWRHGLMAAATTISPQWPYGGGRPLNGPMGSDPEHFAGNGPPMMSPGPSGQPPMGGYNMRYGMPPPNMSAGPMFSPPSSFVPLPGTPGFMNGPPPNMQPMSYGQAQFGGMPPQFMNQPMFSPSSRPQHGPSPGQNGPGQGPGPGMNGHGPGQGQNHNQHHQPHHNPNHHPGQGQGPPPHTFYQNQHGNGPPQQVPTPLQTPHMQNNMQFPPPTPFQMPPAGQRPPSGHGNGSVNGQGPQS